MIKTYSELILLKTFEERYEYLRQTGVVGEPTFGSLRYLNQHLYTSRQWRNFRNKIIVRDSNGGDWCCDLGCDGHEIRSSKIIIHHIEPLTISDIRDMNLSKIMNPDNVICTTAETHRAIHYGDANQLMRDPVERRPNDTCPWK